jgi:hypothetical protein
MDDYFADLLICAAVVKRSFNVQPEFMRPVQSKEGGNRQQTSGLEIETRPIPNGGPSMLRDDLLQWPDKIIAFGPFQGCIDIVAAKYLTPDFQPSFKFRI